MRLAIPAGALAHAVEVSIEQIDGTPDSLVALSPVYLFGPEGLAFLKPVTVEMAYDDAAMPAGARVDEVALRWSEGDGPFERLATAIDVPARVARAEIDGFSRGVVALDPALPNPDEGSPDVETVDEVGPETTDGDSCEADTDDLVCCTFPQQVLGQTLSAQACAVQGGTSHDDSWCEPTCCLFDATRQISSVGACGTGGGIPAEAGACDEICCLADEAAETGTMGWPDTCQAADGVAKDPSWCQQTCCQQGTDYALTSIGDCLASGGSTHGTSSCETICCWTGEPPTYESDLATLLPFSTCVAQFGTKVADTWCEPACCGLHGALPLPASTGACAAGGSDVLGPSDCLLPDALILKENHVATLSGGEYVYSAVYVDGTSAIRLKGDTTLRVEGPFVVHGIIQVDRDDDDGVGVSGASGADGESPLVSPQGHGEPGQAGLAGGDGQDGVSLTVGAWGGITITGEIDLAGADGGEGGVGGRGGDGTGMGTEPFWGPYEARGNGGNGGNGGGGGGGGDSGNLTLTSAYGIRFSQGATLNLSGGNGGLAAAGGDGGHAWNGPRGATYVNGAIGYGGIGGSGGTSGSGGNAGSLTLMSDGCIAIQLMVEVDLSGGDSPSPLELPPPSYGGNSSLPPEGRAGAGGRGLSGGAGGKGGAVAAFSMGDLDIASFLDVHGGTGGSGTEGGPGGLALGGNNEGCRRPWGGDGGAGGAGGPGGDPGSAWLLAMRNARVNTDLEEHGGDGGAGGAGGWGSAGDDRPDTEDLRDKCGEAPVVDADISKGGAGGAGGNGGNGGYAQFSLRAFGGESVFVQRYEFADGKGGAGGKAGQSGRSGTEPQMGLWQCPPAPGAGGRGGDVLGSFSTQMGGALVQGNFKGVAPTSGPGGAAGDYASSQESCASAPNGQPIAGATGQIHGSPDGDVVAEAYQEASAIAIDSFTGPLGVQIWAISRAAGDCDACLAWPDPDFPACPTP